MRYCAIKSCDNSKGVQHSQVHMFRSDSVKKKKLKCENKSSFFVLIFGILFYSFPKNPVAREAWQKALVGQECGSGRLICIEHFLSDDYVVSKDGKKFDLKPNAIPSLFNVLVDLMDSDFLDIGANDQNFYDNASENAIQKDADILKISSENENLHEEVARLKRQIESDKIFTRSRIEYYKEIKKQQANAITDLKQEVERLKQSVDQLTNEKNITYAGLNVKNCCYSQIRLTLAHN